MQIELRKIPVASSDNLHLVHETALRIGRHSGLSFSEQVEFGAAVAELAERALASSKTVSFSMEVEGGTYWMVVHTGDTANSVRKQVPEPLMTPERPVNPSFWKGREELEKSQQDMEQFTFAISHDLKNSLTKLKLALSLVEEEDMPDIAHNYIQVIHRSAERLEKTMMSLNAIIELGHTSPSNIHKISVPAVFSDVYDEFSENLNRINASVKTDFDQNTDLNYVEIYLKSVLTNLMSNAIKYRATDKPLQLQIGANRIPGGLLLSFIDNGIGMDLTKFGNKLFLPFTRFSGTSDGSGLGLYLVKSMVERNGGRIELESRPGEGTSYRIFLREYDPVDKTQS